MKTARSVAAPTTALRAARRAWALLHVDSARSVALADKALAQAVETGDADAEAWARLARGFHLLFFAAPREATVELAHAQRCFDALGIRAGHIVAAAGLARAQWREGKFRPSLERLLPLRDEGLRVLKSDQRGVFLNAIAGCYSALGESEQAFAYMYEALRDTRPSRGRGFDAVLHCNLAHELLQLGDYDEALRHVDQGLARCAGIHNPRLGSVLLINRIICLTELGRAPEALLDVLRVRSVPTNASGRGVVTTHFETLALAALGAGETELGRDLVDRALRVDRESIPDEHVELAIAQALLAGAEGRWEAAADHLMQRHALTSSDSTEGLSLRVRCDYFATLSRVHESAGETALALASLRAWQRLQTARARLASRARYQAAALQTELLRLQHRLDENDARRSATERAHAELEAINRQLSRKVEEVQSLQAALRQQATRDALTGLFNRRHLNEALPAMFSLAQRDTRPLAVVVIDLDHFKAVNDTHGHAVGDRLLAAFGRLLAGNGRRSDVACRYGGEEFCLLMPRTDELSAQRKVHTLLKRWRDESFDFDGAVLGGLTFSAGVADSAQCPGSAEALLRCADHALLSAKRLGRNRVLAAGGLRAAGAAPGT